MILQEKNARKILWNFRERFILFFISLQILNMMIFLAERLIATMDRFGLEIEPYENGNLKHVMWSYVDCGVSEFYKTVYCHEMKRFKCSYHVNGTFRPETDIHLIWPSSHCPKHAGYLNSCQEKFQDGLPTI